jgi:formiminotetrahydrofolate cyclodeaminase
LVSRKTLAKVSIDQFAMLTASTAPTPGGGSSMALAVACAAALGEKVARKSTRATAHAMWQRLRRVRQRAVRLVEEDAQAYRRVVRALRAQRPAQIRSALRGATRAARDIQREAQQVVLMVKRLQRLSPAIWTSDVTCAQQLAAASVQGSAALVRANEQHARQWMP